MKSVLPTELVTMSLLRMRLVDEGVLYWLNIPIGLDMTKVSTTVVVVVVVVAVRGTRGRTRNEDGTKSGEDPD